MLWLTPSRVRGGGTGEVQQRLSSRGACNRRPEWSKGLAVNWRVGRRVSGGVNTLRGDQKPGISPLSQEHWVWGRKWRGKEGKVIWDYDKGAVSHSHSWDSPTPMGGKHLIHNPLLKEMNLLQGVLSDWTLGRWVKQMDTLQVTFPCPTPLQGTPAQFLKIHVAKSCGYSHFNSVKTTTWEKKAGKNVRKRR